MPVDQLSGWSKVAMRAMTLDGWEWGTLLAGVWVAGVMLGVLLAATMWMYRGQTALGETS